jgi:hypothetical protein
VAKITLEVEMLPDATFGDLAELYRVQADIILSRHRPHELINSVERGSIKWERDGKLEVEETKNDRVR